jgi:shikimate kinase
MEVLLARCMTMTGRPLFRDEASFRALHAERLPSYRLADYRVETSGEPTDIVADILRLGIVASGGNQAHLVVEKPLP